MRYELDPNRRLPLRAAASVQLPSAPACPGRGSHSPNDCRDPAIANLVRRSERRQRFAYRRKRERMKSIHAVASGEMPASMVTAIGSPAVSTKYGCSRMAEIAARTAAAEPAALNPSGVRAPIPTIETGYLRFKVRGSGHQSTVRLFVGRILFEHDRLVQIVPRPVGDGQRVCQTMMTRGIAGSRITVCEVGRDAGRGARQT